MIRDQDNSSPEPSLHPGDCFRSTVVRSRMWSATHRRIVLKADTRRGGGSWLEALMAVMLGGLLLVNGGCRSPIRADASDLERFPLRSDLAGTPPAGGLRYWSGFKPLPYHTKELGNSYVSIIHPAQGGVEFWANSWGTKGATDRTFFVRRGPSLRRLGPEEPVFDGTLIDDVFVTNQPSVLAPGRGVSRPSLIVDPEEGYVLLCGVCPEYLPGAVPMLPALFVSKTGARDTWTYLGTLKGEPAEEAERTFATTQRYVWINGGGITRLPDGRWRIYLNGFDRKLAALESDLLRGPWRFLRDDQGRIRELLGDCPIGAIFPHLMKRGKHEWHLWGTDTWPPQSIWHYRSADGLAWEPFGLQPEITRAAVGGRPIKCLRTYYDPKRDRIVGLLAVWCPKPGGGKGWLCFRGHLDEQPPASTRSEQPDGKPREGG